MNKRTDSQTLTPLRDIVKNPNAVPAAPERRSAYRLASSISDSIPCIIITDDVMQPVFEEYALYKKRKGINTTVITVDSINQIVSDALVVDRIRKYIRTKYDNKHTDVVLLGGDIDIVPPLQIQPRGVDTLITDMYYSCLDTSNHWNQDGDPYIADPENYGDTVDYDQLVVVGRIPCGDSAEAAAVVNKIISYETDTSLSLRDYQTEALITSSIIDGANSGLELNDSVRNKLPSSFTIWEFNEDWSDWIIGRMNAGTGLLVNNSHAANCSTFMTSTTMLEPVTNSDIDGLSNTGEYGVFLNWACYNNMLDSADALSRHWMLNPSGGGVGYMGSVDVEQSTVLERFHLKILQYAFASLWPQAGLLLAAAKTELRIFPSDYRVAERYAFFSTMYLGDPQMRIWTASPGILEIGCDDTLRTGSQSVAVRITSGGQAVEDAQVCLSFDTLVYQIGLTAADGWITFDNVSLNSTGTAYVVATKQNYFVAERAVLVGGCCGVYNNGFTGNCNCSSDGKLTLSDCTNLIDHVYISKNPLCCHENGNTNGSIDGKITMSDITRLIDRVYISKSPTARCPLEI